MSAPWDTEDDAPPARGRGSRVRPPLNGRLHPKPTLEQFSAIQKHIEARSGNPRLLLLALALWTADRGELEGVFTSNAKLALMLNVRPRTVEDLKRDLRELDVLDGRPRGRGTWSYYLRSPAEATGLAQDTPESATAAYGKGPVIARSDYGNGPDASEGTDRAYKAKGYPATSDTANLGKDITPATPDSQEPGSPPTPGTETDSPTSQDSARSAPLAEAASLALKQEQPADQPPGEQPFDGEQTRSDAGQSPTPAGGGAGSSPRSAAPPSQDAEDGGAAPPEDGDPTTKRVHQIADRLDELELQQGSPSAAILDVVEWWIAIVPDPVAREPLTARLAALRAPRVVEEKVAA